MVARWEALGLCGIALVTAAAYWPTLDAGFVWDDRAAILGNFDVLGQTSWSEMMKHDFWGQDIGAKDSHKSFRPVTTTTFRIEHWLEGGGDSPNARMMHATNLLLHIVATLTVHEAARAMGTTSASALAAALLFGVHPVHVDAVASLVGRAEVLAGIFFALSVACYARSIAPRRVFASPAANRDESAAACSGWPALARGAVSSAWVAAALLCMTAGLLSKEVGITAVAVFLALEAVPPPHPDDTATAMRVQARLSATARGDGGSLPHKGAGRDIVAPEASLPRPASEWRGGVAGALRWALSGLARPGAWARLVPSLAAAALMVLWRFGTHASDGMYKWRPLENRLAHMPRSVGLALSTAMTHAESVRLILWPTGMAFDHGLGCSDLVFNFTDPRNLLTVAVYSLLLAILALSLAFRRRAALLGMAVFVASYAPAANVLVFVGLEVAERVMYIPSAGLIIALVDLAPVVVRWAASGAPLAIARSALGCEATPSAEAGDEGASRQHRLLEALGQCAPPHSSPARQDEAGHGAAGACSDFEVLAAEAEACIESSDAGDPDRAPVSAAAAVGSSWARRLASPLAMLVVAVSAVLAAATSSQSMVWKDEPALFLNGILTCPGLGVKAANNYAYLLVTSPEATNATFNDAEALLRGAIYVWPMHASAYLNLALLWSKRPPAVKAAIAPDGSDAAAGAARASKLPASIVERFACGPPSVDGLEATARRLNASGEEAAVGPLWMSAVSLHATPSQTLFWLAKYYLLKASSKELPPPAFTPEKAISARERGMPEGSIDVGKGEGFTSASVELSALDMELGGGAMVAWALRFVIQGERKASEVLVRAGTALDHGIVPASDFSYLRRHSLPYPAAFSLGAANDIRARVSAGKLGARLIEEATESGCMAMFPIACFRWRALAASLQGNFELAAHDSQQCIRLGDDHAAHAAGMLRFSGDLPSQGKSKQVAESASDDVRACRVLAAGSLVALGRVAEAEQALQTILAGLSAAHLSDLAGEVRRIGLTRLSAELAHHVTTMPGFETSASAANNAGFALEHEGRAAEAAAVYRAALQLQPPPAVEAVLRMNLARAEQTASQALAAVRAHEEAKADV